MNIIKQIARAFGLVNSPATDDQISTDEIVEAYAGVSAGVQINRKCSILSDADTNSLEQAFIQLDQLVERRINKEFLAMVRETSTRMAEEAPNINCGQEARDSVLEAQEVVAYWLRALEMQ